MTLRNSVIYAFGFSWILPVSPAFGFDLRLGFPWISLDSLVRIGAFQWVSGAKRRRNFFVALSIKSPRKTPPFDPAARRPPNRGEGGDRGARAAPGGETHAPRRVENRANLL